MISISHYVISLCAPLILILVAPLWGQEAQQDKCSNMDPTKLIVCLSVPNDNLTVNRRGGEMSIYASILASAAVAKPVRIKVTATLAANPSGVKLDEGVNASKDFEIDASHPVKDELLLSVKTSSDNPTSGRLTYKLELRSDDGVKVQGSPGTVMMATQP